MDNSKLLKLVIEQLNESVNDEDIVDAWNEICSEDDKIYPMSDFNEVCDVFNYDSPKEIIDRVRDDFDGFDLDAEWFYNDCNGWCAIDNPMDKVDDECLAQHIIDGEVECGGIDVEELKKECAELRPFRDIEEFKNTIPIRIGEYLEFREKERPDIAAEAMLVETGVNAEGKCYVVLGRFSYEMQTLFDKFEYRTDGDWKPFGIANTDSESEE